MPKPRPLENRHRSHKFSLPENQEKNAKLFLAAVVGAIFFHLVFFGLCAYFGWGINLHTQPQAPTQEESIPLVVENTPLPDEVPPLESPPQELPPIEHDKHIELPDIIDLPLEELVIAPGKTEINLNSSEDKADVKLPELPEKIDVAQIQKGLAESMPDPARLTENDVKIKTPILDDLHPQDLTLESSSGAGGTDDGISKDGSVSLQNLLNQPSGSLGKGSGFSSLGADLLFEYDKAVLKSTALKDLITLAALIEKNKNTRFIIEGHTDSFGNAPYNKKLSFLRADAVRQWLAQMDIPLERVFIRACGSDRPVVDTAGDREIQAANRRVEIHMRKSSEALPEDSYPAGASLPDFSQATSKIQAPAPSRPLTPSAPATPKAETPKPATQKAPSSVPSPQVEVIEEEEEEVVPAQIVE